MSRATALKNLACGTQTCQFTRVSDMTLVDIQALIAQCLHVMGAGIEPGQGRAGQGNHLWLSKLFAVGLRSGSFWRHSSTTSFMHCQWHTTHQDGGTRLTASHRGGPPGAIVRPSTPGMHTRKASVGQDCRLHLTYLHHAAVIMSRPGKQAVQQAAASLKALALPKHPSSCILEQYLRSSMQLQTSIIISDTRLLTPSLPGCPTQGWSPSHTPHCQCHQSPVTSLLALPHP